MYLAVEGLNHKREAMVLSQGRQGGGPFKLRPPVQLPVVNGNSPKWEDEGACQSSPKLQPLSGAQQRAQSQLGFTGKYGQSPHFYIKTYPMAFA